MIRIHNSLTGEKQALQPIEPGHVRMYSCGVTVYDYFHVGNARMLVVFDMVSRYLRHRGYRVTYVRNITDVDDKIINRAREAGVDWREHAKKFAAAMHEDLEALGCLRPEKEPKAFDRHCPIRNVTKDYPPTLLLHGDVDTDVPYQQSVDMAGELKRVGVEHELLTFKGYGHGFDGKGFRDAEVAAAFTRIEAFLKKHLAR